MPIPRPSLTQGDQIRAGVAHIRRNTTDRKGLGGLWEQTRPSYTPKDLPTCSLAQMAGLQVPLHSPIIRFSLERTLVRHRGYRLRCLVEPSGFTIAGTSPGLIWRGLRSVTYTTE